VNYLYKTTPWTHENPYHIRADWKGHPVLVGSTDHWKREWEDVVPAAGQNIYVEAKQGVNPGALHDVLALLEEEDIAIPDNEDAVLKTDGGATWGVHKNDEPHLRMAGWETVLRLARTVVPDLVEHRKPAQGTWAEKVTILEQCQKVMSTGTTHSMFSRFAQAVGTFLADDLAERIDQQRGRLGGAELDDAAPAPPAPGYHDRKAFPEMDHQPIPGGTDNSHFAAVEQMDQASTPGEVREQASLRLPAREDEDEAMEPKTSGDEAPTSPAVSVKANEKVEEREHPGVEAREQASLRLPARDDGSKEEKTGEKEKEDEKRPEDEGGEEPNRGGQDETGGTGGTGGTGPEDEEMPEEEEEEEKEEEEPPNWDASEPEEEEEEEDPLDVHVDMSCKRATGPEFFGWHVGLSEFTGIDRKGFEELVPALKLNLRGGPQVARLVVDQCDKVSDRMAARGLPTGRAAVRKHVEQMRYQHLDLQRRKEVFDKRFGGAASQVETFMKEHRVAFAKSHQQTVFRGLDLEAGLQQFKVKSRQHNRFNSMLHECFGGRHSIRTYLQTGKLVGIKVPPLLRPDVRAGARRMEPKPAPNPNAARKREKYFDALIVDMQTSDELRQPETRTTKLWAPFVDGVMECRAVQHNHYKSAAESFNFALSKQRSRELSGARAARSRSKPGEWRSSTVDRRDGWRNGGEKWSNSASAWQR